MSRSPRPPDLHAWDCDQVRARLPEFLDGELPAALDTVAREHLAVCAACLGLVATERRFRAALARARSRTARPAPDSLRSRVRRELDDAQQGRER